MNTMKIFALVAVMGVMLTTSQAIADGCSYSGSKVKGSSSADKSNSDKAQMGDIVDVAVGAESFTTLVAAVKAAGLVDVLKGDGPFTVFAPTDEAFAKLPEGTIDELLKPENKDTLVQILTYHVVPGAVTAAQVVELDSATTAAGLDVTISVEDGGVMVNNANVVQTDIMASNGVIHVIDTVILPPASN